MPGRRRTTPVAVLAAAALAHAAAAPTAVAAEGSLLGAVEPFVGTDEGAADFGTGGGSGATFPGATVPFGMVQPRGADLRAGATLRSDFRPPRPPLERSALGGAAVLPARLREGRPRGRSMLARFRSASHWARAAISAGRRSPPSRPPCWLA